MAYRLLMLESRRESGRLTGAWHLAPERGSKSGGGDVQDGGSKQVMGATSARAEGASIDHASSLVTVK